MSTLRETFLNELADIYDAEKQIVKGIPKVIQASEHEELKTALEDHLGETERQIERLDKVFQIFGQPARGKKCKAMEGLLEEAEELIEDEQGDAALICAAQKVEHYEMASYGSLCAWAKLLEEDEAIELLQETLDEEKAAYEKLTEIAESSINVEEEEEEEAGEEVKAKSHRKS